MYYDEIITQNVKQEFENFKSEQISRLPITVFECDKKTKQFKKLNHIMEGWESERICLETVTKTTDITNGITYCL